MRSLSIGSFLIGIGIGLWLGGVAATHRLQQTTPVCGTTCPNGCRTSEDLDRERLVNILRGKD